VCEGPRGDATLEGQAKTWSAQPWPRAPTGNSGPLALAYGEAWGGRGDAGVLAFVLFKWWVVLWVSSISTLCVTLHSGTQGF